MRPKLDPPARAAPPTPRRNTRQRKFGPLASLDRTEGDGEWLRALVEGTATPVAAPASRILEAP